MSMTATLYTLYLTALALLSITTPSFSLSSSPRPHWAIPLALMFFLSPPDCDYLPVYVGTFYSRTR